MKTATDHVADLATRLDREAAAAEELADDAQADADRNRKRAETLRAEAAELRALIGRDES